MWWGLFGRVSKRIAPLEYMCYDCLIGWETTLTHIFLKNEDDRLETRSSGVWAKEKLSILHRCISMFTTSMRKKPWAALNYIDLEAGPGKNRVKESGDVFLGSPLIALTTEYAFDNYFFVEKKLENLNSLERRVGSSPHSSRVRLYNDDCNEVIGTIVREIKDIERRSSQDKWSCLNLVFIDPEGLEIHWRTIKELATKTRSDLVVNFSTSTITRMIKILSDSPKETAIDEFFGTREWRQEYELLTNPREGAAVRRSLLDYYCDRLSALSYVTTGPTGEHIILNSKNRQLYTLICASKNPLGVDFFEIAAAKFKQTGLPGFH